MNALTVIQTYVAQSEEYANVVLEDFKKELERNPLRALERSQGLTRAAADIEIAAQFYKSVVRGGAIPEIDPMLFLRNLAEDLTKDIMRTASDVESSSLNTVRNVQASRARLLDQINMFL